MSKKPLTRAELKRLEQLQKQLEIKESKLNSQESKLKKEKRDLESDRRKLATEKKQFNNEKKQFKQDKEASGKNSSKLKAQKQDRPFSAQKVSYTIFIASILPKKLVFYLILSFWVFGFFGFFSNVN